MNININIHINTNININIHINIIINMNMNINIIEDAYGDAPPPPTFANEPLREDRHLRFVRCYNREVSKSY